MLALGTWIMLFASSVLFVVYMFVSTFMRQRRPGEPAIVKGSLIWGSAIDFNTHAVEFLHKATKKYGNIFTIRLINQYLTIINDVHSYEALAKERNFDFDPIQKQVNWNVFSFILNKPKKMIKDTSKTVRGANLGKSMVQYVDKLDHAFATKVDAVPKEWSENGLKSFASDTIFTGLFNSIFGNSDSHVFNARDTCQNFEVFHKYFNFFWLGFPKKCFPSAMKALESMLQQPKAHELINREDCSEYIRTAIDFMVSEGQTEGDIMGHNLVYLHVNYNTYRLAFWVLNNILTDEKCHAALMDELSQAFEERKTEDGEATFTTKEIESLPILDSICQESMRISSGVFMVRYIQQDTQFTGSDGKVHLMRAGDRVAMYPPAIHKDPEIFEEPLEFRHDRFVDATFYKDGKVVKHPVIAFGSLCPGQRYAIMQLKWYIMSVFSQLEMKFKEGEKPAEYDYQYHGHEILPPVKDVSVQYRQRTNPVHLRYEAEA